MKKSALKLAVLLVVLMGVLISLSSCSSSSSTAGDNGTIYIYCYGDYYDEDIIAQFEEETGIKVVEDSYDTAEELYTLLSNSDTVYDCICTSDYMIEKMIEEGMLAEIDYDNVPNIVNMDEVYMEKAEEYDPGNAYSIPYTVGVMGIAYDATLVGDTVIDSWDDLWDEQFADQIVMPDSIRDALLIGLVRNGYSINSTSEEEINIAADDLIAQKSLVYKYANDDARDLLGSGSAIIGVIWNGEYIHTYEMNENIEFVVPEEGTEFFIDAWAIPANCQNKEGAEAWLDFLCRQDVAYTNFEYLHYSTPNAAAKELIDEEYLENESIFPSEETIANCWSLKTMSDEVMEYYSTAWKRVKAE